MTSEHWIEDSLARLGRWPLLRRMGVGSLAHRYTNGLSGPTIRLAQMPGYRVYVDLCEYSGSYAFFHGEFELHPSARQWLQEATIFFDVGANYGHWSLLAASLMQSPNTGIHAFEANPEVAAHFRKSTQENGWDNRIAINEIAVSDRSGETLDFYIATDQRNSGTSSLVYHGVGLDKCSKVSVLTSTIDDYCERHEVRHIDLLKMDVERAEYQALLGAEKMLLARRINRLVVEMETGKEAWRLLESLGYCYRGPLDASDPIEMDHVWTRPGLRD